MKREPGYYWVLSMEFGTAVWMVARWDGRWWELPGNELDFSDSIFLHIKEKRLQEPD